MAKVAQIPISMARSSHLVCSQPNIWVFDGCLSQRLVDHINAHMDGRKGDIYTPPQGGHVGRQVRMTVGQDTCELIDVLANLACVTPAQLTPDFVVRECGGAPQPSHMDCARVASVI